ncbi:putative RNA recognition motif domain, nucleotide-binding alpha-beta plait domain superfamily [Helianthus annuus]|nr:putative RNA recognition motif domain, nucleotide-binding alpha-beta plait domain superfamily [Helianthus annuus]
MVDDGPWLDSHHMRKKEKKGASVLNGSPITKIFVTNLPTGCTPWEVSEFIKVFGEVAGVYIARKMDKFGNSFCFISFKNVWDVQELVRALNRTKMGNSKLKANVARFAVENVGITDGIGAKGKRQVQPQFGKNGNIKFVNQAFVSNGGGKLFSELFKAGEKGEGSISGAGAVEVCDGKFIEIPEETQAFKELSGKALVGRCFNLQIINNLKVLLLGAGTLNFSLSYLGGLSVLVKFSAVEECNSFVASYDRWNQWFSSLDHWLGQSLTYERIAWIKIYGVPIHLAVDKVFDSIARQYGKVIHASQRSSEDIDYSVNCIGVLVGDGCRVINQTILKWKDKSFRVWVDEELEDWMPDCFNEEDSTRDEDVSSQFVFDDQNVSPASHELGPMAGKSDCPELHGNPRVHERLVERECLGEGGNGSVPEDGERSNDEVFLSDPIPQKEYVQVSNVVGSQHGCGPSLKEKEVFFFNSDNRTRPNIHKVRIRPKCGDGRNKVIRSPSSGERPRKRPRESG